MAAITSLEHKRLQILNTSNISMVRGTIFPDASVLVNHP